MERSLIVLALALFALPASAQTRDQNWAQCESNDPAMRIKGCTALIQAGQESTENLANAYNNRGVGEEQTGLYDKAIADTTQAIAIKPDFAQPYAVRGLCREEMGLHDAAIADYGRAIALHPASGLLATFYSARGNAYESKGRHDAAMADFNLAITLDPGYVPTYNRRAWAYHLRGEDSRGLPDAEKAVAMAPKDADYIETRAEIYEKLGRSDAAVADYRAALQLDPGMKEAQDGMDRLAFAPPSGKSAAPAGGRLALALLAAGPATASGPPLHGYDDPNAIYRVERTLAFPGDVERVAAAAGANGDPVLELHLSAAAAARLNGAGIVDRDLALVLDGRTVLTVAHVRAPLGRVMLLSGSLTGDDIKRLVDAVSPGPSAR